MFKTILKKAIKYCLLAYATATIAVAINDAAYEGIVYLRCDSEIEGTVADFYEKDDIEKAEEVDYESETLFPIIEYTVNGKKYIHHSSMQIGEYPYKTGTIARVLYSRRDPGISMLNVELYGFGKKLLFEFLIAVICITVALFLKEAPKEEKNE